ncbi:hypothetical protein AWB73_01489 [Caballeronia turbans]|uniref:hypothetical protein n=1 Tax=Caballeronia sp. INML2 TaxID=2921748 RepID=UPI00074D0D14|nr:hypothetical protein [Caballeronia sp. INML2]SAL22128.1 hypothetical protein AWB73_01489 [Caballeronia turbans]
MSSRYCSTASVTPAKSGIAGSMTGYADKLERAKHVGVTILSKPFNIGDLQALLQSVKLSRPAGA